MNNKYLLSNKINENNFLLPSVYYDEDNKKCYFIKKHNNIPIVKSSWTPQDIKYTSGDHKWPKEGRITIDKNNALYFKIQCCGPISASNNLLLEIKNATKNFLCYIDFVNCKILNSDMSVMITTEVSIEKQTEISIDDLSGDDTTGGIITIVVSNEFINNKNNIIVTVISQGKSGKKYLQKYILKFQNAGANTYDYLLLLTKFTIKVL